MIRIMSLVGFQCPYVGLDFAYDKSGFLCVKLQYLHNNYLKLPQFPTYLLYHKSICPPYQLPFLH
jgi:hypothetical protein